MFALLTLISGLVMLLAGFAMGYVKKARLKAYRDVAFIISAALGYLAIALSFFASPYVTWEGFFGIFLTFQSQLALIYYRLGEIGGTLKSLDQRVRNIDKQVQNLDQRVQKLEEAMRQGDT